MVEAGSNADATDPLLPQAAVCDRHQDQPARRLVASGDGGGDCYLCEDCFRAFRAGGPLPFLRHSPRIRQRGPHEEPGRTPRRRARPKSVSEAEFLHALFAYADLSLVVIDESGKIIAAAGPRGGVLGHTETQRTGILDHVHPDDLSVAYARLAEVTQKPEAQATFQIRARHADGSTRLLAIQLTNRLSDPMLRGLVIRSRDLTPR
jgi:PAS domain-containing protein